MKRKRRKLVTSLTLAVVMLLSLVTPIQPNSSVLHSHAAYATPSDAETEQFASVETTKNDTEQTESIYMGDTMHTARAENTIMPRPQMI